ncbi:heavy-metal-associated domain-containing protein [Oceanibaculum pacificum]|uniref:HMA domain-containing protein n=1 Tax=Oceanibaculum pacificum TaxID=580166 RepID=A0A154WBV2_9PROT|nr:heavy-metal-associated domain-containing protein [Oceanibaculum pacificum]KZD11004.1 hypothetical protein AUP43_05835 [Oceanibaculum pacificum]
MPAFKVSGMSCGGCVAALRKAVLARYPQAVVTVDLREGEVTVSGSDDAPGLADAIEAADFTVERRLDS